jgi:hypothetical protein
VFAGQKEFVKVSASQVGYYDEEQWRHESPSSIFYTLSTMIKSINSLTILSVHHVDVSVTLSAIMKSFLSRILVCQFSHCNLQMFRSVSMFWTNNTS